MTLYTLLWFCLLFQDAGIPQKPSDEFKVELEYKFKSRPSVETSSIDLSETMADKRRREQGATPLPYLVIHLSFSKLSDQEVRVKCTDNNGKIRLSKKVVVEKAYTVDLGFTEDMKDRVTAHEYVFVLVSPEKKDTSQIILRVEEDGTFLINDVRRGKF